jgi:hypothetical protein
MKLWKFFVLCVAIIFSSSSLCAQLKPEAMLLPIYFVDLDKNSVQGSLNNFVKTELSNYYILKSEKEVEQARDAAADQISSENCTEEACVKVMGELLDVDYTFSMEIIDTGEGWDLSVVRQHIDGVTSRRNELCDECSLSKARKSLAGILTALRPGQMIIQRGKASLRLESTPVSEVYLDGRKQGKTPLDLSINARETLDIFMVAEGYNDFAEEFILKPGEKRIKHAKLTRKRGNIRITSNPTKASIYVDGILKMDSQDKKLLTPANLRLSYGQHELKLQLDKHEVARETLRINKKNLGKKNLKLIPKPGRLIVRVPSDHKEASIRRNKEFLGRMNGKIINTFEVPANIQYSLQAVDGNYLSETKTVRIEPDGSEKVEFEDFTDSTPESKTFKSQDSGWMKDEFSWTGADWGLLILMQSGSASFATTNEEYIYLGYGTMLGFGLQWKRLRFEGYTGNSNDSLYYSDGENTRQVISSSASVSKILYAPKLPESSLGDENRWIWGVGYEIVNISLETQKDGDRTITAGQSIIDFGYQWNYKKLGLQGYFENMFAQIKFALNLNNGDKFSFIEFFNFGIGSSW